MSKEWTSVTVDEMASTVIEKEQLESLTVAELRAFQSAQDVLGSSFSVVRSKGFAEWKAKRDAGAGSG